MKKKFISDVFLNLLSTGLPLIILQLISMPLVAKQEGSEDYGIIIVVISILTLISFPIGNVLNNIRLLKSEKYLSADISADFPPILVGSSFISILVFVTSSILIIEEFNFLNGLFQTLVVMGLLLKDYWVVAYRIELNFKGILYNNMLLSAGYLVGSVLYILVGYWELIYLLGLIFSLLYIMRTTAIWREPLNVSIEFKETFSDFIILYISGFLKNLLNYADKIILLPLLGPTSVAIYYSASIVGKIVSMIFGPINSVILSYLTKIDRITNKIFLKGFIIALIAMTFGYFITILVSPFILKTLYPEWVEDSLELIYITTAAIYISILSSLFQPFNLRYNKIKWQFYMSVSNILIFISLAIILTPDFELIGFSFAVLISSCYTLIFQVIIFLLSQTRK